MKGVTKLDVRNGGMLRREVIRDLQRTVVTLSVVGAVIILGIREVIDAAAITGLLGAAIGVVGTTSAVAAERGAQERERNNT